jgi:hypothetical protein
MPPSASPRLASYGMRFASTVRQGRTPANFGALDMDKTYTLTAGATLRIDVRAETHRDGYTVCAVLDWRRL